MEKLEHKANRISQIFGSSNFSVLWKGNYLYAGSGPFYETDVLEGIAAFKGMLWHNIYQIDDGEEYKVLTSDYGFK